MFEPNSTIGWSLGRLRSTATDLIAFIRAPALRTRDSWKDSRASDVAWLFLLNGLIVLAVAMILFPMMMLFGVEMSSDMSELFNRPPWQILLLVVFVAPVAEELTFRFWIAGTPRLLVLFLGFAAWIGSSYLLSEFGLVAQQPAVTIGLIAIIAVATFIGVMLLWKSSTPTWYVRIFPVVFWCQALLFGFVHVFNYAGDSPAAVLPFVLPQLVGGLIWGYARIRYGWWANIVMHMAYNLIATSGLTYMLLTRPAIL